MASVPPPSNPTQIGGRTLRNTRQRQARRPAPAPIVPGPVAPGPVAPAPPPLVIARTQVELDAEICASIETEAAVGVPTANSVTSWNSLPPAELRGIAHAIGQWQTTRNLVTQAQAMVTAATSFSGSQQDNDVFGNEVPDRPDYAHYARCESSLLAALQTVRNQANALIAARRAEWRNLTSGQWLDNLITGYDAAIASQTAKLATLPGIQVAAQDKLAERQRRARGLLSSEWVGHWMIGAGSTAAAHLWLKQDRHGIIQDRVCIKDTDFALWDLWDDLNLWSGGGPDDAESVPTEVQAMYNLRGKIGSEAILKVRNWRLRRAEKTYRTITEYCPGGDLFDLTITTLFDESSRLRYYRFPTVNLRAPESVAMTQAAEATLNPEQVTALAAFRSATPPMIPEPFVWYVVEALATAGLLMQLGELDTGGISPWEQIVHCDLKHENLFMSPPNPRRYAGYPQLKLGDFGYAVLLKPNDTRVPSDFTIRGTAQTMAPEQHRFTFNDTDARKMMSSATNVYGVGAIVWQMLAGRTIPVPTGADGRDLDINISDPQWFRAKSFVPPALDATAQSFYSDELIALTYSMCQHDDQARPTFRQILNRMNRFLQSPGYPTPGLREAAANDPRYQGQHSVQLPAASSARYAVGLALSAVPLDAFEGDDAAFPPTPPTGGSDSNMDDDLGGGPAIGEGPDLAPPAPA